MLTGLTATVGTDQLGDVGIGHPDGFDRPSASQQMD